MGECPDLQVPEKWPVVLIEWEDSAQAVPQWQWLSEISGPRILVCRSVGFLIADEPEQKLLAVSVAHAETPEAAQASGVIAIPTRAIRRLSRLTCDGSASPSGPTFDRALA
jgi:hypothetical protein